MPGDVEHWHTEEAMRPAVHRLNWRVWLDYQKPLTLADLETACAKLREDGAVSDCTVQLTSDSLYAVLTRSE